MPYNILNYNLFSEGCKMQREITRELVRRLLPERMAESNKGSYGSVLAAAGSTLP